MSMKCKNRESEGFGGTIWWCFCQNCECNEDDPNCPDLEI